MLEKSISGIHINDMGEIMTFETIRVPVNSELVSNNCPVSKKKFKPGELVMRCTTCSTVYSQAGLATTGGQCPICNPTSDKVTLTAKPPVKPPSYADNRHNLGISAVVGLLLLFCLVIGVGVLAFNSLRGNVLSTAATPTIVASSGTNQPIDDLKPSPIVPSATPLPPTSAPLTETKDNSRSLPNASNTGEPQGRIVYSCNDSDGFAQVCMINPDGSNEHQLTSFSGSASTYPSISSNGLSIIFTNNKTGDHAIYEMDLSSRQINQLTDQGGDKTNPRLSPDGRYITYTDVRNNTTNIYVMNRDGSGLKEIYTRGSVAVWSPSGSQFAFICLDENSKPQLCTMNTDGSNVRKITDIQEINESVSWSPDGTQIAFSIGNKDDKNRKICVISPEGNGFTILYDAGDAIRPTFSPDGNWIVFINYLNKNISGRGEVFIMRKDGSDLRRITNNDRNDWLPFWGN